MINFSLPYRYTHHLPKMIPLSKMRINISRNLPTNIKSYRGWKWGWSRSKYIVGKCYYRGTTRDRCKEGQESTEGTSAGNIIINLKSSRRVNGEMRTVASEISVWVQMCERQYYYYILPWWLLRRQTIGYDPDLSYSALNAARTYTVIGTDSVSMAWPKDN